MRIEIIETVQRLFDIEANWDALYRSDPHAHVYLSPDFLCAIAVRVEGDFRFLTAWSDDNRCIGLLPLIVRTRPASKGNGLVNVLDMLGHVFDADYTGLLCEPGAESQVCQAFAAEMSRMPVARIVFNYFSGPAVRLEALTSAFDSAVFDTRENEHIINDGQTNNRICPYIELPAHFDQYLASLGTSTRQKLRRLLRQLDDDPALTIRKSRPETYTQDVTTLARLWYQKHVGRKGEKRTARLAEIFREVVMLGLASGIVYLAIVSRDGKPIAAQANFIDHVKRQALFHVAGRDDNVRDLSVGLLLQAHCIRWAISQGLARFDFTLGNEPYKYSLGGVDREIYSAELVTRSGVNTHEILDPGCRDNAIRLLRRFVNKGREADARRAASQIVRTWPDIALEHDLRALTSQA